MSVFAQALATAIAEKESKLRCDGCGHKQIIHKVSETGRQKVSCLGNRQKCKCQNVFPSMNQLGSSYSPSSFART